MTRVREWFREAASIRFNRHGDEMSLHVGTLWLMIGAALLLAWCAE